MNLPLRKQSQAENPEFSTEQLLSYCYVYQADIFVREFSELNGWITTPLAEVKGRKLLDFLIDWNSQQKYPHRLIREQEKKSISREDLPHE